MPSLMPPVSQHAELREPAATGLFELKLDKPGKYVLLLSKFEYLCICGGGGEISGESGS